MSRNSRTDNYHRIPDRSCQYMWKCSYCYSRCHNYRYNCRHSCHYRLMSNRYHMSPCNSRCSPRRSPLSCHCTKWSNYLRNFPHR